MNDTETNLILERARAATDWLAAPPGLAQRIAAMASRRRGVLADVARLARPALVAAALAAAASVALLVRAEGAASLDVDPGGDMPAGLLL